MPNRPSLHRRGWLAATAGLGTALAAPRIAGAQQGAAVEDTLDRIQRTGQMNLGVREATPPYGFKDAAGNYTGFATEIAQAIFENVNRELGGRIRVNYVPVTSQTRIPLLQNNTIDMEAGATVVTRARIRVVDFTVANFVTATEVLVPANSPIRTLADLAGRRVGVPQGGLEMAAFRDLAARGRVSRPITAVGFPDHPQGFTALQTGAIEAYASDGPILYRFATDAARWRVFDPGINSFLQAFPLRPGSSKFRRIADLTIVAMCADGRYLALHEKYFGPGASAPYPMTDMLRALITMNSWPEQ